MTFTEGLTGTRTTLFRLMAPLRPVLLFHHVANAAAFSEKLRALDVDAYDVAMSDENNSVSALRDTYGDFAAIYGMTRNFICLVRPDGHVGLISSAPPDALVEYLTLISDPTAVRRAFGSASRRRE